jgi:hypothetical protein
MAHGPIYAAGYGLKEPAGGRSSEKRGCTGKRKKGSVIFYGICWWIACVSSMPRQVSIEFAGAMYHVMARGNRRAPIVQDDQDRVTFLRTLAEACEPTGFLVHAYVLMRSWPFIRPCGGGGFLFAEVPSEAAETGLREMAGAGREKGRWLPGGATCTGALAGGAGKFSDNAIRTVRGEKERLEEMPPCRTDPGGNHDETGLDQRGVGDENPELVLPADLPNTHQSREGSEAASKTECNKK